MNAFRILQDIVIPEPQYPIPLGSDYGIAFDILNPTMLPTIGLDDQLRPMAGEIDEEVTDRNLSPEMQIREAGA